MDSAALPSLTPFLDGVDRWAELLPLLPVLVALELVLSADNAIALAAVARKQNDPVKEKKALNYGIAIAFFLRVALILLAQWVLAFKPLQLLAGIYLLWLFLSHIWSKPSNSDTPTGSSGPSSTFSFPRTIVALALTDLAFSIDSVAAAVAISDQLILVITGALIGVVALRFTSGLFIRWLDIYTRLETAGYLAVALVGIKLIFSLIFSELYLPEWLTLLTVALLMIWGFSERKETFVSEV